MIKYEVIIYWSEEDAGFIAEVPELSGCAAHTGVEEAPPDSGLKAEPIPTLIPTEEALGMDTHSADELAGLQDSVSFHTGLN